MAFSIEDNIKRAQEPKSIVFKKTTDSVKKAAKFVTEQTASGVSFLILWTAVGWYYFFSGLYMVLYRKLPKGWHKLERKDVVQVIGNYREYLPQRKEQKKYGRVVDLDSLPEKTNLLA